MMIPPTAIRKGWRGRVDETTPVSRVRAPLPRAVRPFSALSSHCQRGPGPMNELVVIRFRATTGDGARISRCTGIVVFEATSNDADDVTRDSRRTQTILGCGARRPGAASFRRQHLGVVDRHGEHGLPETPARKNGEERSPICENWALGNGCPSAATPNPYPAAAATGAPPRPQAGRLLSPRGRVDRRSRPRSRANLSPRTNVGPKSCARPAEQRVAKPTTRR